MNCSQMLRGSITEKYAIHFIDYRLYYVTTKKANSGSKSYESVGRRNENSYIQQMFSAKLKENVSK